MTGGNSFGAMGDGGAAGTQPAPIDVGGFTTAAEVTVGSTHVCARFTDGSAKCWGRNHVGQTGNGTTDYYAPSFPSTVTGLTGVTHIVAGFEHTCASTPAGLQCWGANDQGQLGDGTIIDQSLPVTVLGSFAGAVPAPGEKLSCAQLTDGTVRCWGSGAAGGGALGTELGESPVALVSAR